MLQTVTIAEQVASHLREGLMRQRWTGQMPGRGKLAAELGVNVKTVERALARLEKEGLLEAQGAGKRRRIVASKQQECAATHVKMLLYEESDALDDYILELRRSLTESGHQQSFASKTLTDLKHDPKRVAKIIKPDADKVWVLVGASRPVLEWVAGQSLTAFALFGRMTDLPLAGTGPDKSAALREALSLLIEKGHRRIVMMTRAERRNPGLGEHERLFLEELKAHGVSIGSYNIPDWEESAEGLNQCLDDLFQFTPPTAFLVSDTTLCLALKHYLASHRGHDLRKVILICNDYHKTFDWCLPQIPHFCWNLQPIVRRVVQWVNHVAAGKEDRQQKFYPAKFVGGDVIHRVD